MSSIYIQEPPTNGKICLKTTVGEIDIELWSKECPKACRNFVQLCMEGYYNGTIFHRVVPEFIVQGGDPTGSGMGGESIYGEPFKDEFHSRLKFVRRGLVAMANAGANDNGSQFFFTLDKTPDLQGKHTIFGKVVGNTLYNMIKLGECEVDKNERPLDPHKIIKAEILNNPFSDIVPRTQKTRQEKEDQKKSKASAVKAEKNFNLLSFGDEAEEDEEVSSKFVVKAKSAHDILDDEKLSAEPAVRKEELFRGDDESNEEDQTDEKEELKRQVTEKLRRFGDKTKGKRDHSEAKNDQDEKEEDLDDLLFSEKRQEDKAKMDALKMEFKQLQKEMAKMAKKEKAKDEASSEITGDQNDAQSATNQMMATINAEAEKYQTQNLNVPPRKSAAREQATLKMLERFKQKMENAKGRNPAADAEAAETSEIGALKDNLDVEENPNPSDDWLAHKFKPKEPLHKDAKDANVKTDETFTIYDPRNPINERRRGKEGKSDQTQEWDDDKRSKRHRHD